MIQNYISPTIFNSENTLFIMQDWHANNTKCVCMHVCMVATIILLSLCAPNKVKFTTWGAFMILPCSQKYNLFFGGQASNKVEA
jgi:hypothetical protein